MTKKHFETLAFALFTAKPTQDDPSYGQWVLDCAAIALACAKANPRFDSKRFLAACDGE